uniref:Ion_trans_2 domain-containing protein n=1 Tax=Heterorhabditis bacteriophora TaxID=37862 RepID=A0A1I7WH25_HETBA
MRCDLDREETLSKIRFQCSTEVNCFDIMRDYLDAVEQCYKNWHKSNRTITHSMNEFTNALVYAFSFNRLVDLMTGLRIALKIDYEQILLFGIFCYFIRRISLGFGDVFPRDSKTILINAVFIVFGVVLFSMCYFILQEEIRNKAFEASHRARISISKYSNTILHHASR